ncbi:hypothetical protein P8H27_15585 [Pseudomonas sp. sp1636]|uniref:hypothetical protein n=1 Tax=Pseudomonas sp. sp1636 TaxID=3036707 RepID=UPI0025A50671|nr:hypothetical protein [Pseudomonas sp. sp1636]MDM8350302.1 hypothetical protein [Pseudomonas sp. sp1636]
MPSKTPENAFLARIRSRRSTRSYLWLVYSHKIRTDLILESNQEFAHWLLNLEFDAHVVDFWIPAANELYGDQVGGRRTRPDVVAKNADGVLEWHEVKAGYVDEVNPSQQIMMQRELAANNGALYRLFDESTRTARQYELLPRLRLMHFIAVGRNQPLVDYVQETVLSYVNQEQAGTFGGLLQAFPMLAPTHLICAMVRLTIEGFVTVEVEDSTPSQHTVWSLRGSS